MIGFDVALVIVGLLAWDYGRRWVAREHDASDRATDALVESSGAHTVSLANGKTLDEHAIGLTGLGERITALEKRQTSTADSVRILKETKASQRTAHQPILGARKRG